jgi:hypothetical protein
VPYGIGFTFDDTIAESNSLSDMRTLAASIHNRHRIHPYIGGSEVNTHPTHEHHRYIISLQDLSETEARKWPDLMRIVEIKVRPERERLANNPDGRRLRESWWQWGRDRPALKQAIQGLHRVLVTSQTAKYRLFAWLPTGMIYDQKLVVFALAQDGAMSLLQSRVHESWSLFLGSSMKDDPVYTPSDCFQTFPFPLEWQSDGSLNATGKRYCEFRAELMVRNNEGLTTTYNRFHDPDERSPDILKLRELHAEMDRAVLTAYGWTDLAERATCEFRLDYEDDDDPADDEAPRARAKKKPWRYRWPQDFHDEVLARLLDLNQQRAEQERLTGLAAEAATKSPSKKAAKKTTKKPTTKKTTTKKSAPNTQATLLPDDD